MMGKRLFELIDVNKSGRISRQEFCDACHDLLKELLEPTLIEALVEDIFLCPAIQNADKTAEAAAGGDHNTLTLEEFMTIVMPDMSLNLFVAKTRSRLQGRSRESRHHVGAGKYPKTRPVARPSMSIVRGEGAQVNRRARRACSPPATSSATLSRTWRTVRGVNST